MKKRITRKQRTKLLRTGIQVYVKGRTVTKAEWIATIQGESVWLNMNSIAELFGASKQTISYHLQNIYKEGELLRNQTVKEILTVQDEGGKAVKRAIELY